MELGTRAATYQSWSRDGIRVFVRELQEKHPKAGEERLVRLLADLMLEDEDARVAAAEYAVRNMLHVQQSYAHRKVATTTIEERRDQRVERRAAIDRAAKATVAKILYLNAVMPNGKRVRYCDGNYIASVCGPLAKAGKKAGSKLMGQVFSEESLREFMGV